MRAESIASFVRSKIHLTVALLVPYHIDRHLPFPLAASDHSVSVRVWTAAGCLLLPLHERQGVLHLRSLLPFPHRLPHRVFGGSHRICLRYHQRSLLPRLQYVRLLHLPLARTEPADDRGGNHHWRAVHSVCATGRRADREDEAAGGNVGGEV